MRTTTRSRLERNATIQQAEILSLALVLVTFLATVVRMAHSLQSDFPINDGGMFYVMIQDLQANGFRLPAFTTYNADSIPFLYPPFGLYFAGLLQALTGWDLLDILRIFPGLVAALTVPAFYLLSGVFFERREPRLIATLAFAFFPQSFQWLVSGGGITRAFGMLFSILALWLNVRALERRSGKNLAAGILLTALTVYSHPEAVWFLTYSTAFLFAFKHRSRKALITILVLGAGSLVLISPWLLWMFGQFGQQTIQPMLTAGVLPLEDVFRFVTLIDLGTNPFLPVLFALGVLGFIACLVTRRPLLPAWVLLIYLIQRRAPEQRVIIPFALMAAQALDEMLAPWIAAKVKEHATRRVLLAVGVYFVIFLPVSSYVSSLEYARTLPQAHREAMAWVNANTPADSRFLVFPEDIWIKDRAAEWFPALAKRQSVTTVQGHEWLPGFAGRGERHFELLDCGGQGLTCLENWSQQHRIDYDYLFFSEAEKTFLQGQVEHSPEFRVVYEAPGVVIYHRTGQTAAD